MFGHLDGAEKSRQLVKRCVLDLVQRWRQLGIYIPIVRHCRFACSWASSLVLRDVLSTASALTPYLCQDTPPPCRCSQLLGCNANWPCVTVDGQQHIASPQGRVPWPNSLQHLAHWPASISLPPRRKDMLACVRDSLRRLRQQCRIRDDG